MEKSKGEKSSSGFHDRYATDADFKKRVDATHAKRKSEQGTKTLQAALDATRGKGSKRY